MGIENEYALNRNKEIAALRQENEYLKASIPKLTAEFSKSIDAILYQIVKKYGSKVKHEVRIPIPDTEIKCKVSTVKTGDKYIIRAVDITEE